MTPPRSPRQSVRDLLRVATVCLLLPAAMAADAPATDPRDWSQVQLAWREDPRPPADTPSGVDVPAGRRGSRRAQRRAASRRRQPLDDLPIGVAPAAMQPRTTTDSNGFDTVDPALIPATSGMAVGPPSGTAAAIQADATLASPFRATSTSAGVTTHRDQTYGT